MNRTTSQKRGRPALPEKRRATRIHPYLRKDLHARFRDHCSERGQTESAVIQAAVTQYLSAVDDHTLVMRRLDRLGRANDRLHRDVEILSEGFGLFVQFWFAHTPTIPENARDSARRTAAARYKQFARHLAEQFAQGRRFVDDLPKELLVDERELEAIARNSTDPSSDKSQAS